MSAFGQAGFGSMNRRNQLRAQGQLDPYGQQVRAAKQAPTLNIYQTPSSYQQATGQQQAPSQSQPAQQPAAARPSAPAMPAYSPSYSAGTAQPIPPQSQGTPPASGASESPAMSATWNADQGSLWLQQAVQTGDDIALLRSGLVDPGTGAWIGRADDPAKSLWDATAFANNYAGNTGWNPMGQGQWSLEPVDRRDGRLLSTLGDPRADVVDWNNMTFRPNPEFVKSPLATAYEMELQGKMPQSQWTSPGTAQPIQPQSQGTPYGADPGYADRVAAAEQQWSSTPAGSQKRDWEGNTARNMLARGLPPDMAARDASGMSMDVVRASQDLEQRLRQNDDYVRQLRATDGVVLGPNQRWMQPALQPNAPQQVYEIAGVGVGPDGKTMQPIYQPAKGKLQLRSQSTPGQAQPIQPQTQGTPYQSQPMVNDRPMRSIEDDMAADREYERQNGWWAQESARRGIDKSTGAPLAGRTNEQAAYADFVSRPQPIGPETPQFNFDTSQLKSQQDQLMQQSNAAVYKALRRDSPQGNQSPMVSGANDRLRRMLSQNMMLDTWRKKQQAGG